MEKNKELIIFIPSIEDGGVEKNLYIILNYLSKKRKNLTLITYDNKKNHFFSKNIKVVNPWFNFINFRGRYPKYFLCLGVMLKILLFNRNCSILSFQANIFAIIIAVTFGIKITSRSNSSSQGWSKNYFKQLFFNFFFKKADKIIVNSFEFKKEMDKKYKINTLYIPNPFEFKKIFNQSKKKTKKFFKSNVLKLVSVGRLTYQKDFATLIRAINLIKRKDIELVIIGKGKERSKLIELIKQYELQDKIKLIGYKKNPFNIIAQADIFILTSLFEGSPNVLVEALYLKKYIISTDCPTGPREILNNGKFGTLVKIKDYKNIAKNLKFYSSNNTIKKKIKSGFKSCKKYDYETNCNKYYEAINKYL